MFSIAKRFSLGKTAALIGLLCALASAGANAGESALSLDQGWDKAMQEAFYFTPQGSRLMPYKWFLALETATGTTRFSSPANMTRYGWLHYGRSRLNPDDLPIGFVKDPASVPGTGQWVGMTCAACHTGEVIAKGTPIRVDGAPSMANFGMFTDELSAAIQATLLNEKKFEKFAADVDGHSPSKEELAKLKGAFAVFATDAVGKLWMRTPHQPAGPGRVDALNQIINALSVFDLGVPENLRPIDAPVSYPPVWTAPALDWVQYVPVATSPIARNSGEVLGVFGDAEFKDPKNLFRSSLLLKNLDDLEKWIADLKSPPWPEKQLGRINTRLADQGHKLFNKDCRMCHNMPPYDLTAKADNAFGKQFIKIKGIDYKALGTDPQYNLNLLGRTSATGSLGPVLFDKAPVTPGATFFLTTVGATLKTAIEDAKLTPDQIFEYNGYRFYPPKAPGQQPQLWQAPANAPFTIKAGPLFGVWATGPYLHNGSVPNIYELLSPPEERSKGFWVGSREIDPVKLGFKSTARDLSRKERAGLFYFDTSLPGNHNTGHVYPKRPLTRQERFAIIEYLKSVQYEPLPGIWKKTPGKAGKY